MPVLPDVASSRIESGLRRPLASRSSTSARATRSLTDPVGLAASSLAKRRTAGFGESLEISTTGVPPIDSTSPPYRPRRSVAGAVISAARAAGDRREQSDLVTRLDGRLEPGEIPDVAPIEVDVDEAMQLTVRCQQLLGE